VVTHSLVGSGAVIEAGAVVTDSVILAGAHVQAGARVTASIVAGHLGARAHVERCVIASDGRVSPGEVLFDGRRPEVQP
jgi:ADP-glucose pyrophosphorylase